MSEILQSLKDVPCGDDATESSATVERGAPWSVLPDTLISDTQLCINRVSLINLICERMIINQILVDSLLLDFNSVYPLFLGLFLRNPEFDKPRRGGASASDSTDFSFTDFRVLDGES